ncbi:MAG: hypothetical protein QOG68_2376 [Solirubrobacteraceae bacterium]|nr:hypothetical protein [Solirubrobacteraceae bacterium]
MLRRLTFSAACGALVVLAGCGGDDSYKNQPRPPQTLVISASILPDKVSVSPSTFGAGPISLTIANETDASQRISIVHRINGQSQGTPPNEQTGPINPHDTATLKADVDQGDYEIRVEGAAIKPAKVSVGSPRPSAQNDLLQP